MQSRNMVDTLPALPARPDDAHKGTFGTVYVVGGSPHMIGAPAMTATAALRTGAGLVKLVVPQKILTSCLTIEPSATGVVAHHLGDAQFFADLLSTLEPQSVLAIGPGIGVDESLHGSLRVLLASGVPKVVDADGLNNLAAMEEAALLPAGPLVLTPHPGEYRRLAEAAAITHDPTDPKQRPDAAAALAEHFHCVVVLKGHRTIVADAQRLFLNTTGNPALATAGSGDVLTGVIASLLAQGMNAFDAAMLGVHLHGRAADLWAARNGRAGLLARELADLLPQAMQSHNGSAA